MDSRQASGPTGPTGEEVRDQDAASTRWRRRVHRAAALVFGMISAAGWGLATDSWVQGALFGLAWYALLSVAGRVSIAERRFHTLDDAAVRLRDRVYGLEVMMSIAERRDDRLAAVVEQQVQVAAGLSARVGKLEREVNLLDVKQQRDVRRRELDG